MQQIDIEQAKIQLESLFQAAINGDEIIITQNDQPILKLVSLIQPKKRRQSGSAKGLISMSADFDEPLDFID
ncbi:MAG TPA: type II toxin-antitoxin system prevent-host-death family antitoxin [Nostocaceae cyanobacterium]|nr:type II toxin-antitoxin system prevent-host-death family antitoxin [Nostocaceae cyanobacterium]